MTLDNLSRQLEEARKILKRDEARRKKNQLIELVCIIILLTVILGPYIWAIIYYPEQLEQLNQYLW